ncbi:MAG TPA: hypothetical protein DCQ77_05485 [Betaproteobacteria bacterium]|nr:hypothetical protein [Betaproteobacteria bacterium]
MKIYFPTDANKPGAEALYNMRLSGLVEESYKIARWGVGNQQAEGTPVWDGVEQYLKNIPAIKRLTPSTTRLIGVEHNPGFADA